MPKSQTPRPANVINLQESASEIKKEIMLFFTTLLTGLAFPKTENYVWKQSEQKWKHLLPMSCTMLAGATLDLGKTLSLVLVYPP